MRRLQPQPSLNHSNFQTIMNYAMFFHVFSFYTSLTLLQTWAIYLFLSFVFNILKFEVILDPWYLLWNWGFLFFFFMFCEVQNVKNAHLRLLLHRNQYNLKNASTILYKNRNKLFICLVLEGIGEKHTERYILIHSLKIIRF